MSLSPAGSSGSYCTSKYPAGSSLGLCSNFPSLNPYYKKNLVLNPIWWEAETNKSKKYLFLSQQQAAKHGGLLPYHQTKQPTWNPTNHSHGLSTADASFQPFSAVNSESLKPVLLKTNLRKSFEDHLWSPYYIPWQIPRDDNVAANINCRQLQLHPAAVPAPPSSNTCRPTQATPSSSSCTTKQ